MRRVHSLVVGCAFVGLAATTAQAQNRSWGDVAVSVAAVDFDLSGTGQATGVAVRMTREMTRHLVLEARGLFTQPTQQFDSSTVVIPEGQLHYRWHKARWTPFAGAGLGAAAVRSDVGTDWDATVAFSGGTGFRLTDRVGMLGEMRVRGVGWRFTGSLAEWTVGLAWRIP